MTSRVVKAKRKIRCHVKQQGSASNFNVTPTLILYWWRELNHALFKGALRLPDKILVRDEKDVWGWCFAEKSHSKKSKIAICISDEVDDKAFFLSVLAHEMIHQWEQQTIGYMSHGKNFWSWKDAVEKLGLEFNSEF